MTLTGLDCTALISLKGKKAEKEGCNDQSAHWQLAVQLDRASTTLAAPVKKCATTSDLVTFQGPH